MDLAAKLLAAIGIDTKKWEENAYMRFYGILSEFTFTVQQLNDGKVVLQEWFEEAVTRNK